MNEFLTFLRQEWPQVHAWAQSVIELFGGHVWLLLVVLILVGALVADTVARFLIHRVIRRWSVRHPWLNGFVEALPLPLSVAIWLHALTLVVVALSNHFDLATAWHARIYQAREALLTLVLAWYVIRVVGRLEAHLKVVADSDPRFDRSLVSALGKVIRLTAVVIATLIALSAFGVNVTGLLAFGGAGGLVVGLAAKDMVSNLFGGLSIYLDRPFAEGDWIRSPDKDIEGVVEHIGWRRTVIRRFNKNPLYVPNGVFTTIVVENPSRMSHRRIYELFGVRYMDLDKVPQVTEEIRTMLQAHPDIDQSQTIIVNFNRFGDSSLECFVYCFTRTTVWTEYHQVKERILMRIAEIVHAHGADMAFPSQSVYFETPLTVKQQPEQV